MTKEQVDFTVVRDLRHQNFMGLVEVVKNVEIEVTIGFHNGIKKSGSGWFEISDEETGGDMWYASGGLTFSGLALVEYDGVFELPDFIIKKLEELGYEDQL